MTNLIKGRKLLILPMAEGSPMPFEEIFAVQDLRAAKQAFEMTQVFHDAVENNGHFSLPKATKIAKQDPNMVVVGSMYDIECQNHNRVEDMVNRVILRLNDFLNIEIPQKQREQLNAAITYSFTSLNTQTEDAWIFYRKESGHSTTYQYNIIFAVQNPSTGNFVYCVPMGMTIKVDREYERVLFITLKDEISYSVQIEALKVMKPLESYVIECALKYLQSQIVEAFFSVNFHHASLAINQCYTYFQQGHPDLPPNKLGPVQVFQWGNGRWQNRSSYYFNCGCNQHENTAPPVGDTGQLSKCDGNILEEWFCNRYHDYKPNVLKDGYKWNFTLVQNGAALNFHVKVI